MTHERSSRLLLAVLAALLLTSAAVAGLAALDSDAPARLYQLDPVVRTAALAITAPGG